MGLLDNIIAAESGGNANARNPRSSAAGLGQFIDGTWVDMLAKYRPDITGSREQLLALKADPELSKEMVARYAAENERTLTNAGLAPTPGSIYLAHFAGPQGAVRVLQAAPDTPVDSVLGAAAVSANPFLRGMTVANLRAWADKKVGGGSSSLSQPQNTAQPEEPLLGERLRQQPAPFVPAFAPQSSPAENQTPRVAAPDAYQPPASQDMEVIPPPMLNQPRAGPDRLAQQYRLAQLRAAFPMRPFYFGSST